MSAPSTRVTIDCPVSHRSGWSCEGTVTVEVSGRYRPARGFDPPEYPDLEIVGQAEGCQCNPIMIDSSAHFEDRVYEALAARAEESA